VIIAEFSEMFYLLFAILLAVLDKKKFFVQSFKRKLNVQVRKQPILIAEETILCRGETGRKGMRVMFVY